MYIPIDEQSLVGYLFLKSQLIILDIHHQKQMEFYNRSGNDRLIHHQQFRDHKHCQQMHHQQIGD